MHDATRMVPRTEWGTRRSTRPHVVNLRAVSAPSSALQWFTHSDRVRKPYLRDCRDACQNDFQEPAHPSEERDRGGRCRPLLRG
ncbi:hypothetical protein ebA6337 [Aromatoleum aromaticum EbN1]|uniref:Uncharacterized protein n=1 Tax=Aromatoleum aromaticum (strain DSM 19018 / LMG 30748 / EbN1) TaxID=76114 RepID=Q5NYW9_AROAE|nr:hypothetical protein ebA6337 [Aromatoleum aromaticum EbN1]